DLVESLVVLGVVFSFHQFRKRQETKAHLNAVAAAARHTYLRAQELERLVGVSRALATCTDFQSLYHVFSGYLPKFTKDREAWLLICHDSCWDVLVRPTGDRHPTDALESVGERALRPRPGGIDAGAVWVDD